MCKKMSFLVSTVLVLALAGSASAGEAYTWDNNDPANDYWCTVGNWNIDGNVPDNPPGIAAPNDTVTISGSIEGGPTITSGCDPNVLNMGDGPASGTEVVVDIESGGSLIVQEPWNWGSDSEGKVTVNISGALTILGGGNDSFRLPDEGEGYFYIYPGANIYVEGVMKGADKGNAYCELHMYGGDVNAGSFEVGDEGSGNFYMTGGTFVTRGSFGMRGWGGGFMQLKIDGGAQLIVGETYAAPDDDDAQALISLDDGYIECRDWDAKGDLWTLDINEGMLRIKDPTTEGGTQVMLDRINSWIQSGQITGYNGDKVPIATTDGADVICAVTFAHVNPYNPTPAHKAPDICPIDVNLGWTAGEYADTQNMYFGPTTDDVNGVKDPCETLIPRDTNTWSPPGPLEVGTTYYWRVETVNDACFPYEWEGGIWRFTTTGGKTSEPSPEDDRRGIPAASLSLLEWTPSCVADTHKVYYGPDLPENIVLFEDDFEKGVFDANWAADGDWEVWDANEDPNYEPYDHNLARIIGGSGTLAMNVDANTDDACSVRIDFRFRKTGEIRDGDIELYYWDGSGWDFIKDLNSLDPNDQWLHYVDDVNVNDEYHLQTDFKIKFVADINDVNGIVYIDNVRIRNMWPAAAKWYQGRRDEPNYPVSVEEFRTYHWRIDAVVGDTTVQGDHWTFGTGRGGLLVWYSFDGALGTDLPDYPQPIPDDTASVEFFKYVEQGDPCAFVKYGAANTTYNREGTSADFEPNAGLYRYDPYPASESQLDMLRLSGDTYTVEMWFKPDLLEDGMDDIWLIGKNDDTWRLQINDPGDDDELRQTHSGNDESVDDAVEEDEWHHVASVYDRFDPSENRMQLYLNGQLINTNGEEDLNAADDNEPVGIGFEMPADGNFADAGGFFDGQIDELRIYDIALDVGDFLLTPGPEWASSPRPYNGQIGVDPNDPNQTVLSWKPGSKATTHKVYFSTDFDDVNTGNIDAYLGEYEVNEVNDVNFIFGRTYYWRVDEVNGTTWEGVIWKFTTKYLILDENLIVWYRFDQADGEIVIDYSGYEHHGEGDPVPAENWEPVGGRFDGCLKFDDDTGIEVPETLFEGDDGISNTITVSVWLNGLSTQSADKDMTVFDVGDEDATYKMTALVPSEAPDFDVSWRAGNDSNDLLLWDTDSTITKAWRDTWHHLVFIKDQSEGEMYIYFDGQLKWWKEDTINSMNYFLRADFRIGAYTDNTADYEGRMDDFRVYNTHLSDEDILKLFRGGDLNVAWDPSPYNGQPDATWDANLGWKPGDDANKHNVFFGTSAEQVANMTEPCAVKDLGDEDYEPGPLVLDKYYYWRIDEVNNIGDSCTWPGPVWSFKVADYTILDDFEVYNKTTNQIKDTWRDYWYQAMNPPYVATGGVLDLGVYPYNVVYSGGGGTQSMLYQFKNILWGTPGRPDAYAGVCYSEVSLPLPEELQNWTVGGVRVLRLFFYGDVDNDVNATMYVGVKDGGGPSKYAEIRYGEYDPNNEDVNDVNEPEWHRWDIGLTHFKDSNFAAVANDVDLTNIAELLIGFGDKRNPVCGPEGVVIFDDIRLYMPICKPEFGPIADFSGNCIVDMADVGIMAQAWLRHDANYSPGEMQEPNDANLVGWWRLDGDANDSSIYDHNSTVEGTYAWVTGHNDVNVDDLAVQFTGSGGRILVPDDNNTPKLRPKHQVSACAWVYGGKQSAASRVVVKGADGKETYSLEFTRDDQMNFFVRDSNNKEPDDFKNYAVHGRVWQDDWIHLAGTYDGNSVKCYVNGEFQEALDANFVVTGAFTLSQDINDLAIGNRSDDDNRAFKGTIDEVRLYDYGLSAAEVAWLATDGTGYVPLTSPYNLYDKEVLGKQAINFRDLAMLLEDWLKEGFWPPEE